MDIKKQIKEIDKQMEAVGKQINKLNDKYSELLIRRNELYTQERMAAINESNLCVGDCYIVENKSASYHDALFQLYKVSSISPRMTIISVLYHRLQTDDEELSFHTEKQDISLKDFIVNVIKEGEKINDYEYEQWISRGVQLVGDYE